METETYALFAASMIFYFAGCYEVNNHISAGLPEISPDGRSIRLFVAALGQTLCFAVLAALDASVPLLFICCLIANAWIFHWCMKYSAWLAAGAGLWIAFYMLCYQIIGTALVSLLSGLPMYNIVQDHDYRALASFAGMLLFLGTGLVCQYFDEKCWHRFYLQNATCQKLVVIHGVMALFVAYSSANLYYNIDRIWFSALQLFTGVLMIGVYNLIFWYERRIANLLEMEKHAEVSRHEMEIQRAHFAVYKNFVHFNREVRHELREMVATVDYEMEKGRIDEARGVLSNTCRQLLVQLGDEKEMSNNELICSLLYEYNVFCQNQNVSFEAQVFLPEKGSVEEQACHQIIAGTLDALLHTEEKCPGSNRSICLKSTYRNGWLVLGFLSGWGSWATKGLADASDEASIRRILKLDWVCTLAEKQNGIVLCNASGAGDRQELEITMSFPPQE